MEGSVSALFDGVSCTVEIGFSTTSGGANTVPLNSTLSDIVWSDVTQYVRGLSWSRGRSNELDTFQTGSASVVLANADRRFDPVYASSPYAGALTPLRPIRITVSILDETSTTSDIPVFFGYVDGWPQTYELFGDATVTINCSDAFRVLNLLTLPGLWEQTINAENPLAWLRFNDGDSFTLNDEGSVANDWRWSDATVAGFSRKQGKSVAGLIVDDSNQGGEFTDDLQAFNGLWKEPLGSTLFPVSFAAEFWLQSTQAGSDSYGLVSLGSQEAAIWAQMVSYLDYGVVQACVGDLDTPTFKVYTSSVLVNDGKPHHVVINYYGTPGLYVDGVAATLTASGVPTEYVFGGSESGVIGGSTYYTNTYKSSKTFNGTIDEFLIWNRNLSAATVADHYALGIGTFGAGERTDQRAARILDAVGWPSDGRDLLFGLSTLQGARFQGKTALSLLQECEAAEQGMLWASTSGGINFYTRKTFAELVTWLTFGDSGAEYKYSDIVIEQPDADIANRVIVSRNNGATYTRNDTTSQGKYFIRTLEVTDLEVDTDAFCEQLAVDLLRRYKSPQTRINSLSSSLRGRVGSEQAKILYAEIGVKLIVKRRPQSVGSAINQTLQVQAVKGEIGPDNVLLSFDLGPAPTQFFVLDSATDGVLGTSRLGL